MLRASMLALALGGAAWAQDGDDADDDSGLPAISEKIEGYETKEGLFTFYVDPKTGKRYMEVTADQLGEEFIAFTYAENGVLDAGAFRGAYRDTRILRMDRYFGQLELTEVNTAYYFDEDNAISRASDANISNAIIGSLKIVAETEGEGDEPARLLIDASPLFKSEMLHRVNPGVSPFAGPFTFQLGGLSQQKTKITEVRTYPENIDVVVDYTFDNPMPFAGGSQAVTDARSVTLTFQHSFVAMPDDGYEPRFDDYRVGYFTQRVTDLTSGEAANYRDLVNRWRLVKKDPEAEISDPVEPIVWWIENTTPVELRQAVMDGVLAWNEAFESAGFSNAIEVKIQPDDADWDAGDIRYNVLRWTSSPQPPFGGYGPSFANPRTGELLGADIMLEYSFLFNRERSDTLFGTDASAGVEYSAEDHQPADPRYDHSCHAGRSLMQGLTFARAALQASGASEEEMSELVRQSVMFLALHEVGHTLGLNHNMKGTSVYGPLEVHDKSVTQGAPGNSVMDYPALNVAPLGVEQGDYMHSRPGAYDHWAITFGYSPDVSDPEVRREVLARSTEKELAFGNDADDMRSPFNGIDPRTMVNDQSSDPVAYGRDRIELIRSIVGDLLTSYESSDEESYQELVRLFSSAIGQQGTMGIVMSKQIGGVYVERVAPGQDDTVPFTPVPYETQKGAMKAIAEYVFAPDAFAVPDDLIRHLQQQRRGYDFYFRTEDPKLHSTALAYQNAVLSQLLSPVTMRRMTDSGLYGNEYTPALMISDLNDAIFGADLIGRPNTFRRNLQVAYTTRLVGVAYGFGHDPIAQAAALAGIENIKARLTVLPDFLFPAETRAHRAAIRHELNWLLD